MAALAAEVALLKSEKFRQALELETTARNLRLALNRNEELEDEVSKLRAAPPPVAPFYQGPIDPPPPTEPEMPSDDQNLSDLETSLMEPRQPQRAPRGLALGRRAAHSIWSFAVSPFMQCVPVPSYAADQPGVRSVHAYRGHDVAPHPLHSFPPPGP